jgi:hypothetical protein
MVSPQNPYPPTEVAPGAARTDRGFVTEVTETTAAPAGVAMPTPGWSYPQSTYFWGSVIAGTLFVVSLFVLSWFLMLGCHVGVTQGGMLSMGWGTAIWLCITSAIAFYFGGAIANNISRPLGTGWLKGATVWGLSIPLALCIWGLAAAGSGLLVGSMAPHVNIVANAGAAGGAATAVGVSFGAIWTAFIMLIVGLIFSIIGSNSAVPGGWANDRTHLRA